MMRATTMLMLASFSVFAVAPGSAQTAADPTGAAPAAAPPADAPAAPVRSTLKPAPDPGDGTRPRQRLVTVFGTEECPKPTSSDEIVVCARLPDSEIYRIPERLRAANNTRVSPFQANRNLLLGDATGGAGGSIGSCSVVGGGGAVGCNQRQIDAWAQDRTSRMGVTEEIPPQ